ncbi:MAG TPA: aspartate 1-decarboxylase [Thermoanaerobaculia bacterium]|nr:aspartate 1-decarboxylase [Thermoanaerobaculia bacterium]HUM29410.1 aspartate 1-decarboxylase [Thermoanaerobaculia bacterium]HXK67656.1 aspartate 1-decarboxylase [Thermoanaerobaculia bacterium]
MIRTMMKAKLHRARVTEANLDYMGSISVPGDLLDLADILPNERVEVYNITNGSRLATYAIPGPTGQITMNGAAAHLARPGDMIIICSYVMVEEERARNWKSTVILLDENNHVLRLENR